jgi:hypothetical protein
MKVAFLAAIAFCLACPVRAEYSVWDRGEWPVNWPAELEPLRKQARTYEGPHVLYRRYLISFDKREQFEAAWPHLLKVKGKGVPIILKRVKETDFFRVRPAGVIIQTPPIDGRGNPEAPLTGEMNATSIELFVDGEVVDLNRIPLPPDTPIVDERFKEPRTPPAN